MKGKRVLISAAVFVAVCAAGLFIAWIGGMVPFTPDAGFMALMTLIFASASSAVSLTITEDEP